MAHNSTAKKELSVDVGIGYKASYKDKKTGQPVSYLKLYIRPDQLAGLPVDSRGNIRLSAFMSSAKAVASKKAPDVIIKPALNTGVQNDGGSQRHQATTSRGSGAGNRDFPF